MARPPSLSLAFAVRDRLPQLVLCLASLGWQADPVFEVVIVDDASLPPTADFLRRFRPPFPYTYLRREASTGRAAARNLGWRAAAGEVVVFMDGDVLAQPSLVAAHRAGHAAGGAEPVAVSGFPWSWRSVDTVAFPAERPLVGAEAAAALLANAAVQGAPQTQNPSSAPFLSFVTRNVSVRRDVVAAAGGFWEAFARYGLADWELGYRLWLAGARFVSDPAAACLHQAHPAGPGRARDNAHNFGLFLQRHPHAEVAAMALAPPWMHQDGYREVFAALRRLRAIAPRWAADLEPGLLAHAAEWAGRAARGLGAVPRGPVPGVPPRTPDEALVHWTATRDPGVAPFLRAMRDAGGLRP